MTFIKEKIIWIVIAIGVALVAIFSSGLYSNSIPTAVSPTENIDTNEIRVVSTVPANLNDSTILPNQTIELTFSEQLVNIPETRWSISPSADIKAELSDDRKTLKLIPNKPYDLGNGYTLLIKGDTKIEGKGNLDRELIYSFKTIQFKGS
jgi:hypothetical protein